ncbi:MAG: hypothetical protein ACNI27_07275 [Desulfovibrio sp.]
MSDSRRADLILPLLKGKKVISKVELFKEEQFTGQITDLYRVRIDNRWYQPEGRRYTYVSIDFVLHNIVKPLTVQQLQGEGPPIPRPSPLLPKGTKVRITRKEDLPKWAANPPLVIRTRTTPVEQAGDWYIWISDKYIRLQNLELVKE